MKIMTVIAGYNNADVLPFTAKVPLEISEKVIFIDGIRPIIKRKSPIIKWQDHTNNKNSSDNTIDVCKSLGIEYMTINVPIYNGTKINIANVFMRQRKIEFDTVLYLESDEALEPDDMNKIVEGIESSINASKHGFNSFDLIQLWKDQSGFRVSPSCSKVIKDINFKFPDGDEGHNAGPVIREAFQNVIPARMYHLHMFRTNALKRVFKIRGKDTWLGGGDGGGIVIDKVKFELKQTDFLKSIYNTLKIQDRENLDELKNTYVGEKCG